MFTKEQLDALYVSVKAGMSEKRFRHTAAVADMAVRLGELFAPDRVDVLRAAGLLHDITKEYSIEIVKVDKNQKENKNYVIKIVDECLLEETGGIVQGMSGSPILQNGELVGAVTHVFVNDPTRGFGISIDQMLEQ